MQNYHETERELRALDRIADEQYSHNPPLQALIKLRVEKLRELGRIKRDLESINVQMNYFSMPEDGQTKH